MVVGQAGQSATLLTEEDLASFTKRRIVSHFLVENYLDTSEGITSVLGYHYDTYFMEQVYIATAIFGAVGGKRGGYGIAALGLGVRYPLTSQWDLDIKGLVGSGGGGGLSAGGGLAFEGVMGLSYECMKGVFLDMKGGYLVFPTGTFRTTVFQLGVSWQYTELVMGG